MTDLVLPTCLLELDGRPIKINEVIALYLEMESIFPNTIVLPYARSMLHYYAYEPYKALVALKMALASATNTSRKWAALIACDLAVHQSRHAFGDRADVAVKFLDQAIADYPEFQAEPLVIKKLIGETFGRKDIELNALKCLVEKEKSPVYYERMSQIYTMDNRLTEAKESGDYAKSLRDEMKAFLKAFRTSSESSRLGMKAPKIYFPLDEWKEIYAQHQFTNSVSIPEMVLQWTQDPVGLVMKNDDQLSINTLKKFIEFGTKQSSIELQRFTIPPKVRAELEIPLFKEEPNVKKLSLSVHPCRRGTFYNATNTDLSSSVVTF